MATYLVTGGAGFIGSNIVEALVDQGHHVRILDNFSTGRQSNVADVSDRIEIINGDIGNMDDATEAVKDIEVVLHLAAIPSVPKSVDDPLTSNRANIDGALNMLVASRDAGVRRFVFASSSSVYGDQAEEEAKVETMSMLPISPYGIAKMASERYCQVFYDMYGFEAVALRYFNVYGPRQDPSSDYAAVIPKFITCYLQGERPTIFGDGEQTRDFTYIGNIIKANVLAANVPAEQAAGEVFNIALGGQISLNELASVLKRLTNSDIEPIYEDPRPGDIKHSRADITKATSQLGYTPSYSFEEGLRLTIDWYRRQMETGNA